MRPSEPRPLTTGPSSGPTAPFPLKLSGKVVKGFGRGSKELGIPTANIPITGLSVGGNEDVESGIYYGWAGLNVNEEGEISLLGVGSADGDDGQGAQVDAEKEGELWHVYPMVMSIGWNPFYKNTVRSVEVHIMHPFPHDFYGAHMNLLILGYIRPEYDYVSKESLIEDIMFDCDVAKRNLERSGYETFKGDQYLKGWNGGGHHVGS